jgi:hypothetical protein
MVIRLAGESMRSLLFAEVEVKVEAEIKFGLTRTVKNDQALFSRSVARSRYLTQDGFSVVYVSERHEKQDLAEQPYYLQSARK